MHVSRFRITNYKSICDSEEVRLGPGFNVIVGANNAGKTALVEALSLRSAAKPHRSPETVPTPSVAPKQDSQVDVSFELSRDEFISLLANLSPPSSSFWLPIGSQIAQGATVQDYVKQFDNAISERNVIEAVFRSGALASARLTTYGGLVEGSGPNIYALQLKVDPSNEGFSLVTEDFAVTSGSAAFAVQSAATLQARVYYFKAERLNLGEAPVAFTSELAPDASNLAQCLHTLQSNPVRFQRLNALVGVIFSEVRQITVPFTPEGKVRIVVWSIDPVSEREDLAVPLSESGTGLGQVLAILYVVLTAEQSKTIIIDEPQSFLHPGAIRKLIEILKHYERARHQYVITTHSPTVITAAEPRTLLIVRKKGAESIIEQVDALETRDQDLLLREVGARLSDVFGADDILWVEGATDEACFPLILSKVAKRPLLGTKILGVVQTGDFESKHSDTILEIYRRLSEGRGLLPPAVGFIFDREDRDEAARKDLGRRSGGKVVFTNRRMYENYLLNSSAIAAVASGIEGFREGTKIEPEEVSRWLEKHRWDDKYFDKSVEPDSLTEEVWLREVHGAKLLEEMFQCLSNYRVAYDKVVHGRALTRWLCDNCPEDLQDLARLIEDRLDRPVS